MNTAAMFIVGAIVGIISGYALGHRDGRNQVSGRGPRRWWS